MSRHDSTTGEPLMSGYFSFLGLHVQRSRIRAAINRVTPRNTGLRWGALASRRKYMKPIVRSFYPPLSISIPFNGYLKLHTKATRWERKRSIRASELFSPLFYPNKREFKLNYKTINLKIPNTQFNHLMWRQVFRVLGTTSMYVRTEESFSGQVLIFGSFNIFFKKWKNYFRILKHKGQGPNLKMIPSIAVGQTTSAFERPVGISWVLTFFFLHGDRKEVGTRLNI